jgi:hypothetical protein
MFASISARSGGLSARKGIGLFLVKTEIGRPVVGGGYSRQ